MDPQRIGMHIRSIRQDKGYSLQTLAELSGFSKGYVSKLEHGHAQAPIATLMRIAKSLDVSINEIFDGSSAAGQAGTSSAVLCKKDERAVMEASKERPYDCERLAVGSQFQLTPYIIHLDGDTDQQKTYQHQGEEIIYMLKGQCDYRVGDQIYTLRKGDTLTFNAQEPHGAIGLPGKRASYLAVFSEH